MKVGIQSNIYGAEFHGAKMPQMLAEIAQAGYAGIEIGAHRFETLDEPDKFLDLVRANSLQVTGIHTLLKRYLEDREYSEKAAVFTQAVEAPYMLFSGERGEKSEDELQTLVRILNETGKHCADNGIIFCYHNHNWELENERAEYSYLMCNTDPALVWMAVDVGWVQRAGLKPVEFLQQYGGRVRYLHLKDTLDEEWIELGKGTVDFPALLDIIGVYGYALAHERDQVLPNAFESAKTSREYLKSIGI